MRARISWPVLLIVLGSLLIGGLAYVLAPGPGDGLPLSPGNAHPDGARAVAQLLRDHGVTVRSARNRQDVDSLTATRPTTVVITDPDDLSAPDLDSVLTSGRGTRVVLVGPSDEARTRLFAGQDDASAQGPAYPRDLTGNRIILNTPADLTNREIATGDRASVALRALGRDRTLVWVSDWNGRSSTATHQGLAWPPWLVPLVWVLVLTVVLLIVQRGRRFGRLATEPLPVVVKSIESTRALATLYRRNHARETASSALVDATALRIARHLALPRGSRTPADVVAALPPHLQDEGSILVAPPPRTDHDLVEQARRLAQLEKEITDE